MHPQICTIGPFTVYSYGLMLALAFIVASALAGRQAKKENIAADLIFNLCFLSVIAGVLGARIFYVCGNLGYYLKNPLEIVMLQHGGLSFYGGLILGSIAAVAYLKKKKLAVYKALDVLAPFIALAQSIGRVGCLLNGCCFGRESPSGIYFKVHDAFLIPTQIYSSLLLIMIFIALRFLQERPHRQGEVFFSYLLLYSTKRFFIEFWRADNPVILWGLTLFQCLSGAIFFIALAMLAVIKKKEQSGKGKG